MTSAQIREKFLTFFKEKNHTIIPSASLIPENDPTVLFNTAGMQPLVPYLLGVKHPAGNRLADAQKCVRTNDIEEVGDKTHLTFFEMLGNWSLGDYFKEESVAFSWEFLTSANWLNLDKNRLAFTVFEGDNDTSDPLSTGAPFDEESYNLWLKAGVSEKRIAKLGKGDNWWGPAGLTGPCGPDTEIFYWTGSEPAPEVYDPNNKNWVEIWNNVFMAYNKQADGSFLPLEQKNVDTGMGLERILCVINGIDSIYETDVFTPAIEKLAELTGKEYKGNEKSFRIVVDHIRAATMIIGDAKGVGPSNTDQGYVVRKLIRRSIRLADALGVNPAVSMVSELAKVYIDQLSEAYPEIKENSERIFAELAGEEDKFRETLDKGLKIVEKIIASGAKAISGVEAFDLYQTFGFPLEMTMELAKEKGLTIDKAGFEAEMAKHQELSRTASAGKFKGGLADSSEETTRLHTATHLLLAALRKVLGDHVFQKGSNITAERLRLDFSHPDKLTDAQKQEVERLVNEAIQANLPIDCKEMSLTEAKEVGAMGVFESKYEEKVKVYSVGTSTELSTGESSSLFSREICGGPHAENTGELKSFKIQKEEASSAGVRRIKAVIG